MSQAVAKGRANHQERAVEVVNQREIVALGYIQVRITIGVMCRVANVYERVQVGNTGTADSYVVANADVPCRSNVVLDACSRHKGAVLGRVIVTVALLVSNVLPGVFVAATQFDSKFAKGVGILCVSGANLVGIVIIYAAGFVNDKGAGTAAPKEKILCRRIVPIDKFNAGRE